MDLISSLFLGFVQGITEFLPISSSGHIELFLKLLNLNSSSVTFDVVVHMASLIALLIYFKFNYSNFSQENLDINSNKIWIALSVVPIGLVGLVFRDFIDEEAREIAFLGYAFIFSGIILCLHIFKKFKFKFVYVIIFASLFQSLAIFPGISRSGMIIGISLLMGSGIRKSVILSFLMSIPLILLSSAYEIIFGVFNGFSTVDISYLIIAFLISLISSFIGIRIMLFLSKYTQFRYFGIYNLFLGIIILISIFV